MRLIHGIFDKIYWIYEIVLRFMRFLGCIRLISDMRITRFRGMYAIYEIGIFQGLLDFSKNKFYLKKRYDGIKSYNVLEKSREMVKAIISASEKGHCYHV